jgi:hypothetical protein
MESLGLTDEQLAANDQEWRGTFDASDDIVNRFAERRRVLVQGRACVQFADANKARSLVVAEEWFKHLDDQYFALWIESASGWELYKEWLGYISLQVLDMVSAIWKRQPEELVVWYENDCRPALEELLPLKVKAAINRAREMEVSSASNLRSSVEQPVRADDPAPPIPTQPAALPSAKERANIRQAFVTPRLEKKGWSPLDWANHATVDFHTANDYLNGTTKPYNSTRSKLANALGVDIEKLPR